MTEFLFSVNNIKARVEGDHVLLWREWESETLWHTAFPVVDIYRLLRHIDYETENARTKNNDFIAHVQEKASEERAAQAQAEQESLLTDGDENGQ